MQVVWNFFNAKLSKFINHSNISAGRDRANRQFFIGGQKFIFTPLRFYSVISKLYVCKVSVMSFSLQRIAMETAEKIAAEDFNG